MSGKSDDAELRELHLGLVAYQAWAIERGIKTITLIEGRDAAGKDGTIRHVIEHLSPHRTRVVALDAPDTREAGQWWFQRYIAHLPTAGEWVFFNRSWYTRAGLEFVMGYCDADQRDQVLTDAPVLEAMLRRAGVRLIKIWLDVSRREQAHRLHERATDPLKRLKFDDLDGFAQERWDASTEARDEMLTRSHTDVAPWFCVRADDKPAARKAVMRLLIHELATREISADVDPPDPDVVFQFKRAALRDGRLER